MSEVSYTSVGKNHEWRLSHAYNRGGELPVCWEELFRKNITGDIEESIISLDETIEPYLSEYKKKETNSK